jgi:hypothetical protein
MIFVLACADPSGASVLERRILGQLMAAPQIANTSVYRTVCVPFPGVASGDKRRLDEQLKWISGEMEKAILLQTGV